MGKGLEALEQAASPRELPGGTAGAQAAVAIFTLARKSLPDSVLTQKE